MKENIKNYEAGIIIPRIGMRLETYMKPEGRALLLMGAGIATEIANGFLSASLTI